MSADNSKDSTMRFRRGSGTAAVVAVAALASTLAGCSTESGSGTTEISFMPYQQVKVMQPIIDAFEKENPDILVKVNPSEAVTYAQTLQTRIAGGQTPDVFQITSENRSDILNNDLAISLSEEPYLPSVDESFLSLSSKGGKVYGITFTAWMGGLIYNKDLVKAAGFDEFPTDVDGLIELSAALKANKIIPYLEEQSVSSGSLTAMLASYNILEGVAPADFWMDGKKADATFADSWSPAVSAWQKLVQGGFIPTESLGLGGDQIKAAFLSEQAAIYRSGNWDLADLRKSGLNFAVAPFPAYPGGESLINGGGDPSYAVSAKSSTEKQAAAKKFLAFLASPAGVEMLATGQGAQSISTNYQSDPGDEFRDAYENYLVPGRYYWIDWTDNAPVMAQSMTTQQQLIIQGKGGSELFGAAMDAAATS